VIEILFDHSYADDYFMISEIRVLIEDEAEKERIVKAISENGLLGDLGYPDREMIASILNVDPKLIDMDTNEIDLM
jgi:hypothetical protein